MSSSKNFDFEKNSFLHKSNSAFIEQMYLKFINKDKDLPESWLNYFEGIGDEIKVIADEIKGPSWGPEKTKIKRFPVDLAKQIVQHRISLGMNRKEFARKNNMKVGDLADIECGKAHHNSSLVSKFKRVITNYNFFRYIIIFTVKF